MYYTAAQNVEEGNYLSVAKPSCSLDMKIWSLAFGNLSVGHKVFK